MDLKASMFFDFNTSCIAHKISYPVNHGNMKGYYNANPFQKYSNWFHDKHLGVDISGNGGGNSDLGDTVYAIGRGKVIYVLEVKQNYDEFASVIMILHKTPNGYIVSQYRHCQKVLVKYGEYVDYLQPVSTIGNDFGVYQAHLHFEIRTDIMKDIEGGYGDPKGYLDPLLFIEQFNQNEKQAALHNQVW
jgi:murein DD-endopeptidase MepM/ murein hydrolase activator NlpD